MSTNVNPCPAGWREVQPGERLADIHSCVGAVVGELRREGIEVDLSDDVLELVTAAMRDVLMALEVVGAPMVWESYVVAG